MSDSFLTRLWAKVPKPRQVRAWMARLWARAPKPQRVGAWLTHLWARVPKPQQVGAWLAGLWARMPKPQQVGAWLAGLWAKVPRPRQVRDWLAGLWAKVPKPRQIGAWIAYRWALVRAYVLDPEHRIMWGIILLAAALRLGHLDLIQFGPEQARYLSGGLEFVENLKLPLIGIRTAAGVAEPPLMSYILAVPLLFGRDPRIAAAFVASLNVAAVAGCYLLARRYWGVRVALIAATLFAVNPWAVMLSRRVAVAGVLVPLAMMELWALGVALADGKPWGWVVGLVGLGLMVGVSLSAVVAAAAVIVLALIYRRRFRPSYALLGLCLALVLLLPYLYYQNAHRLEDIRAFVRALRQDVGAGPPFRALQYASWIHSGRQISTLAGNSASQFLPGRLTLRWPPIEPIGGWPPPSSNGNWPSTRSIQLGAIGKGLDWLSALTFLVSLPGVAVLALVTWGRWRNKQDPTTLVILCAWLWMPLLLLTLHSGPIEPEDLAILYPAGFLAMGLCVDGLLTWLKAHAALPFRWLPYLQIPIWLILVVLMIWQAYSVVYLYDFVTDHDTRGGYGTPYRFWRHINNVARRAARDVGVNEVWIVTQGTDPDQDEYPLLLSYLLGPHLKSVFLGQDGAECMLLPAGRPAVYLLTRPSPPVERMLSYLRAEEKGLVLFPENKLEVRAWGSPAHDVEEMLDVVQHRGLWGLDSGLCLVGYDLPPSARPGETVSFLGSWTFQDIPAGERNSPHALFTYLVSGDGSFAAARTSLGLPERYWAEGLLLLQWVDLRLPETASAGDYDLLIGMDRLSDSYRHRQIDSHGLTLGEAITLGPVRIGEP